MTISPSIVVSILERLLGTDLVKHGLDSFFDKIEDKIAQSETAYDDALVLPVVKALRKAMDVPDYPDPVAIGPGPSIQVTDAFSGDTLATVDSAGVTRHAEALVKAAARRAGDKQTVDSAGFDVLA
jgi:hypothetical protein